MRALYAIVLREMLILRRRWFSVLSSYALSPLLFMITFGLGTRIQDIGEVPYLVFLVPGLLASSSMRNGFSLSSEINIARFYWQVFDAIRSTPISDLAYTCGEVLSGVVRGLLGAASILIIAAFFEVFVSINGLLAMSILCNTFVFASLAVITAMVVKTHAQQAMLTSFVITPMSFLCGTFFPIENYPSWIQAFVRALPLTHAALTIRAAALDQPFPYSSLGYLAVFGAICFAGAVYVIRASKD
jgi:ABC-type multidrug transport system permease subunit